MENSFFKYLEQLEAMAFFSGFPLIYAIIRSWKGKANHGNNSKNQKLVFLLPYSYALVGILYLGLQLKNLYPDYSIENIKLAMQDPWLKIWALLALFLWIPPLGKKPVLCLLHSLVFFYFLVRDLITALIHHNDKSFIRNDMKIYSCSLLVNLAAFAFIALIWILFARIKRNKISGIR